MSQTWILPTLNFLPDLSLCHSPSCSTVYSFCFHISQSHLNPSFFLYPHQARNKSLWRLPKKKSIQFFCLTEISRPLFIYLFLLNSNIWPIAKYTLLSHFLILSSQTSTFMWLDFFLLDTYLFSAFILLFLRLIQYQVLISNHIYLVLANLNLQSYSFLKAADLCML